MDNEMKEINIEEIMEEIRQKIESRGYCQDIPAFEDISADVCIADIPGFSEKEFDSYLEQVKAHCEVQYYEPITDGRIKKLIKKIMRKLMSFQLVPMTVQQNTFNSFVLGSLRNVQNYIHSNNCTDQNVMNQRQEEIYFEYHEKLVERLETKILFLEQKIESLEAQMKEKY